MTTTSRPTKPALGLCATLVALVSQLMPTAAFGDGTETLGPPSITVASGSGVVSAGTGLRTQPGTIQLTVPAGATVKQALLYWEGVAFEGDATDPTIVVNGQTITGTLIGGETFFFQDWDANPSQRVFSGSYRADITSRGLVAAGPNTFSVSGLTNSRANDGASVVVIYDDGSGTATIGLRDGLDIAFRDFPEPRRDTIPQTINFAATTFQRSAQLTMIASFVQPLDNSVLVTIGGQTTAYQNQLASAAGLHWDNLVLPLTIPAGVTSATVQVTSDSPNPGSPIWIAAVLAINACGNPSATPATSSGSAYAVNAKVLGGNGINKAGLVSTKAPGTPATQSRTVAGTNILGVVNTDTLVTNSASSLDPSTTTSSATISDVRLLGGLVRATSVKAVSTSTADEEGSSVSSAGSFISGLKVGGANIDIAPNTSVAVRTLGVTVAELKIYEQTSTTTFANGVSSASHSVNMLRLTVVNSLPGFPSIGTEIIIGHAETTAQSPIVEC